MKTTEVFCPSCDTIVPAAHINITAMAGMCERCDHLFQLPQNLFKVGGISIEKGLVDFGSNAPPRPKTLTEETGPGSELYIRKSWFTPALFAILVFCIAWDAFLVYWYSIALTQADTPWLMIVFPIGHLAVGVGLTYHVVAGFLNKTHLFTDAYSIIVKHRPIFWFGNKEIDTSGISSLSIYRDRANQWSYRQNNSVPEKFRIVASRNGEQVQIISGLDRSEVRFIGYRLANQLKCDLN